MHGFDPQLAAAIFGVAAERLAADPPALGGIPDVLPAEAITPQGIGAEAGLERLREVLAGTTPIDHPRYMAFIPSAATPAAALTDLLVSAFSV